MLVLLLIYLGIIALWRTLDDPSRAGRAVAIMTLIGFVNIPIIKFSVDWWNTLHQPASVFRMGGPTIHPSMLWPLLILAIGFTLLGAQPASRRDAGGDHAPPGADADHSGSRAARPAGGARGGGMSELWAACRASSSPPMPPSCWCWAG